VTAPVDLSPLVKWLARVAVADYLREVRGDEKTERPATTPEKVEAPRSDGRCERKTKST